MTIKILALAALFLCGSTAAFAQAAPDAPKGDADATSGSFTIQVENDVFNRLGPSDRDYTSGLRIGWMSGPTSSIPPWLSSATTFPAFFGEPQPTRIDRRWGLSLGQNLYTPENTTTSAFIANDRPYAGWLYVGGSLQNTFYKKNDKGAEVPTRQDTLQLDVGIVGPAALGEFTQNNFHRIINVDRVNGWANQLHNEPTLGLTFERRWRTGVTEIFEKPGLQLDFVPRLGAALGNVATYGSVGGQFRIGNDLSIDFGAARPRPSLPGSDGYAGSGFAWYLFAGGDAQVWARNMFIDGNLDGYRTGITRRPFVGEAQAGLALVFEGVRVTFSHVLRTSEFYERDRIEQFGSVSVTFRY